MKPTTVNRLIEGLALLSEEYGDNLLINSGELGSLYAGPETIEGGVISKNEPRLLELGWIYEPKLECYSFYLG